MPKLNGVLIVVLTLAAIATAGVLSMRAIAPAGADPAAVRKLLRDLSDGNPDVRHQAENGFRALGPQAVGPLTEPSKSEDKTLADRASKLLGALENPQSRPLPPPTPVSKEVRVEVVPPSAAELPTAESIEFVVLCSGDPDQAGPEGLFMIGLGNRSSAPVLVALQPESVKTVVAWFEVESDADPVARVAAEPIVRIEGDLSINAVPPGGTHLLFTASRALRLAMSKPSARRVRFVYDASEGSLYREIVKPSSEGVLLPPTRFVSRTYSLRAAK